MWGLFSAQKPSISPPATDYPTKINAICDELDALFGKGADIASAATVNVAAATGSYFHITGSTGPITSLGTPPAAGRTVVVVCDSTPTFTHHATNLILQNAVNYTAVAGDVLRFTSESTGWRCTGVTLRSRGGVFRKTDPTTAAFVKTGAFTLSTQAQMIYVEVDGILWPIAASTAVTMPGSPASGTDYAIWAKTDGTLECTSNHVTPPTTNARRIGGFHYAPGGNAAAQAGGDTTPAINAYSIWDLKFRPACPDPRGMCLVADGFWADIYLLGVDHPTNGSSKYNVTIADGSNPAKIPAKFGGNGASAYGGGNWWDMHEVMRSFGKRFPTYSEFAALAYGTAEAASATAATDPVSTILRAESTSRWGVILSTGNMFVWGDEHGGGTGSAAWTANTGGRGSTYQLENAVLLGGYWGNGADSGSRCSVWHIAPTYSYNDIGVRGVCDHLQLD